MKRILILLLLTLSLCGQNLLADGGWQVESGSVVINPDGFTVNSSGSASKTYTLNFSDDPLLVYELPVHSGADWNVILSRPDGTEAESPKGVLVLDGIFYLDPRVVLSWSGTQTLKVTFTVNSGTLTLRDQGVEFFNSDLIYPPNNTQVTSFVGPDAAVFSWPKIDGTEEYVVQYWAGNSPGSVYNIGVVGQCYAKPATALSAGLWQWRVVAKHNGTELKRSYDYSFNQGTLPALRATFGQVPLKVENRTLKPRNEMASSGIPFEKGKFFPGGNISLTDSNSNPVVVQCDPLGFWEDGSIKWALITMPVTVGPNETAVFTLNSIGGIYLGGTDIAVVQGGNILIDNGALNLTVPLLGLDTFENISVNGNPARSIPVTIKAGAILGASETDPVVEFTSDESAESYIEQNGHLRTVIVTRGNLVDSSDSIGFSYTMRQIYSSGNANAKLLLSLVCKTGSVVREGVIPTVLLDHFTVSFGNISANAAYLGSTEDMNHSREGGKLILDQMEHYMFEIRTE